MKISVVVAVWLLLFIIPVHGLDRFEIITTQHLKQMLEDRNAGKIDFLLVNSLDRLIYEHNSIPGSVNVPWSRISDSMDILGTQKDRMIITYWMGYRWVFAYKTAVAVKNLGYTNVKIYNGGIKDWSKSGFPLKAIVPLPKMKIPTVGADQLLDLIRSAEPSSCLDGNAAPLLTLLDLRIENVLSKDKPPPRVRSHCRTVFLLLDDIRDPAARNQIPKTGIVVTITETGNRDAFAIRYLSSFGFNNIKALEFGMRGWLKLRYPIAKLVGE